MLFEWRELLIGWWVKLTISTSTMGLHVGVSEIYVRRVRSALACSILHQLCMLLVYLALVDASPLQPVQWIKNCLVNFLSLRTFLFVIFISVVTFIQILFFCKQFTFSPLQSSSRLKAAIHSFAPQNIFTFLLHIMIGFTMGYMYINIHNNYDMINEEFIYKVLCASFSGASVFIQNYIHGPLYIQFRPLPGLLTKNQIIQDIRDSIKNSVWQGIKIFLYFNVLYYFCGASMGKALFGSLTGFDNTFVKLNSIFQLMNIPRLFSSCLLCIVVITVIVTMRAITHTSLSNKCKFAITGEERQFLLCDALSMNDIPFVQQLASQDLLMIAESDPARRAELYTLSQPGGHPHNWKKILKPFLSLADKMCAELSLNPAPEIPKPVQVPEDIHFPMSPKMRNMTFESPILSPKTFHPKQVPPASCTSVSSKAREWFKRQIDLLLKKPPVAFIFGERTEAKIAYGLSVYGQTLANLVSAFTTLAQAAAIEDSYGVVQQDLTIIITAILKLKTVIDKLGNVFRKQNKSHTLSYFHMKNVLREATVQGIYKIVVTYKNHLDDLRCPLDLKNQIQNFRLFKET